MDVSIIIVNYNTKDLLKNCLESVFKQTKEIQFEVIVSDNGSQDGSVEMIKKDFPQVILIENNANLGFGAANNRGLTIAQGKYIFYLNSDTLLLNNAVKMFFDYWESYPDKEKLGALGANLLDEDMQVIHSYGMFPKLREVVYHSARALYGVLKLSLKKFLFRKEPPLIEVTSERTEYKEGEVDYIVGADLFLLNSSLARFDEGFFMYCEETDLQDIMSSKGMRRILIPGPQILHLCGASSRGKESLRLDVVQYFATFSSIHYNLSLIYYFRKRRQSKIGIFILKCLLFCIWINPLIWKKTRKFIPQLIKK